jgi:hypothetical protein
MPPQRQYGQQEDTQRLGPYAQRGYDQGGQQAGGDGRWQSPDWRYGQQPYGQGNGQPGYAPGQPHFQPAPPPGQRGFGPPPPQPPYGPPQPPQRGKSWPARHKALTGVLAFVALIIVIVAANSGGSPSPLATGRRPV